ncbi:MAG: hypothetical protein PHQ05_11660 [Sterolibacterium sp.]|nr:hypothetical protein [Sterolibacterium sp.]
MAVATALPSTAYACAASLGDLRRVLFLTDPEIGQQPHRVDPGENPYRFRLTSRNTWTENTMRLFIRKYRKHHIVDYPFSSSLLQVTELDPALRFPQ